MKDGLQQKGFTLIELLVVIATIALLAGVILSSVNSARSRARDSERVQTMRQIKLAIELYFSTFGYYPTCGGNDLCDTTGAYGAFNSLAIVPTYMSSVKNDPRNQSGAYGYYYGRGYIKTGTNTFAATGLSTDYMIGTRLENSSAPVYGGWGNINLNFLDGK